MKIKEECERFQHKFMQSSHERRIIKLKVLLILCIKWGPNQLLEKILCDTLLNYVRKNSTQRHLEGDPKYRQILKINFKGR